MGQSTGSMNKKGGLFRSFNTDESSHTQEKPSLYSSHNQLIFPGENPWMLFLDMACGIQWDIGFTDPEQLSITVEHPSLNLYLIQADDMPSLMREYFQLVGEPYVPPYWGVGFHQCRHGYMDSDDIRDVVNNIEAIDCPIDAIYLDIDYMDNFKNFTFHPKRFADIQELVTTLKEKGIHVVPIIDAGVKAEDGYPVYEEGIEQGFFCKKVPDEKPFIGVVWPGHCVFPDFLNPQAQKWFASWYQVLTKLGIDGTWNDMNEPALFFTPEVLQEALETVSALDGDEIDSYAFLDFQKKFASLGGNPKSYQSFYHQSENGPVSHHDVHNLYGAKMLQAASMGMVEALGNQRPLVFGRSTLIGVHQHAGMWLGDNSSWWQHLLENLQMITNVNLAGFLFSGADLGGFRQDCESELLTRWYQFGIFSPLFRNHNTRTARSQEPYQFDQITQKTLRELTKIRYALIPHLFSEYLQAVHSHQPLFRPLGYKYNNRLSLENQDQVLWGDSLMLAPVYSPGVSGRSIYFPDDMVLMTLDLEDWSPENLRHQQMRKGHHYVDFGLNQLSFALQKGHMFALVPPQKRTKELSTETLVLWGFMDSECHYQFREERTDCQNWKGSLSGFDITVFNNGGQIHVQTALTGEPSVSQLKLNLLTSDGVIQRTVNLK